MAYPDFEPRLGGLAGGIFAIIAIALTSYLTFAALQGEHGLFSLFRVQAEETSLRSELARLKAERAQIQNKTIGLSTPTLDLDLLDQQSRKVLALGRPDEVIIR